MGSSSSKNKNGQSPRKKKTKKMSIAEQDKIHKLVEDYYALSNINTYDDFSTGLDDDTTYVVPASIEQALKGVDSEVTRKFIGCGLNMPELWEGLQILELGCGCGRDAFFMSRLVGEAGHILGIDMGQERITFCESRIETHMEKYGYSKPNVSFKKSKVEELKAIGVVNETYDMVTANCCIVVCPDPEKVFQNAYDALKFGGEMYFTEMYAQVPSKPEFAKDPVLMCEGFASQTWEEYIDTATSVGFTHPRLIKIGSIVYSEEVTEKVGDLRYVVATYRMFKLPRDVKKEPKRITYRGGILDHEDTLRFDHTLTFKRGEPLIGDGEISAILLNTRHSQYFDFEDVKSDAKFDTVHPKYDPFKLEDQKKTEKEAPQPAADGNTE